MLIDEAFDIIKTRLETIDGLTVTTDPAVTVVVPMAVVDDGEIDYNESFVRGASEIAFTVTVYVSPADAAEGLWEARRYLSGHGDLSVRAAIETAVDSDALDRKVTADTGVRGEDGGYITATFQCRAHVPGAVAT